MGKYNGAVLTTAGQQVISSAIAGSSAVIWTAIRTSSAVIPSGTNLEALTSLDDIEQTGGITSAQVYGETVIQVSGRISNLNVETAYLVQAIGLYGKLEGGQETLMAVSTAVTPDQVPVYDADSPAAFIYNVQITVSNASQVTMTVNDAGTATVADLERVETTLINAINALGSTDESNGNLGYLRIETTDATTLAQLETYMGSHMLYGKPFVVWVNSTLFGALCPNAQYTTNATGLMYRDSYLHYMLCTSQSGSYSTFFSGVFYGASSTTPVESRQVIMDSGYGDISNTRITTITASTASYPTIASDDTLKVAFGKINKFFSDIGQIFTGSDSIHQGEKGLVPAPPIYGGYNSDYYLSASAGWHSIYSDVPNLRRFGDNGYSLASGSIICDIINDVEKLSMEIDVSTLADFVSYCQDFVPKGKTICVYLTAQTTNALVGASIPTIGTLCITDNGTVARLLISRTSNSEFSNTYAVSITLSTSAVVVDRLLTSKAVEGVGGNPITATDVISGATALSANTYLSVGSVTLDRGVYYVDGAVRFGGIPANSRLSMCISGATTPQSYTLGLTQEYVGSSNTGTITKTYGRTIRVVSNASVVYFVVATSSASSVDFSRLQATKVAIYQV